jgi:endonuclease VIII
VPEGHSLELAARLLAPVVGQPVTSGPLVGSTAIGIEAAGKNLLIHGDNGRSLRVHLGMHGRVRLAQPGTGRGTAVLRTASTDVVISGTLRVAERPSRRAAPPLGPDLLHGAFDAAEYLRRARLVSRPVGELLLDQRVLAGIGNIVKSEALWERRVDPRLPVSSASDRQLLELAVVSRRILRRAVADRGRLPGRVYRRCGRPCPRCATPIAAIVQGEQRRRTYLCPVCQPGAV